MAHPSNVKASALDTHLFNTLACQMVVAEGIKNEVKRPEGPVTRSLGPHTSSIQIQGLKFLDVPPHTSTTSTKELNFLDVSFGTAYCM